MVCGMLTARRHRIQSACDLGCDLVGQAEASAELSPVDGDPRAVAVVVDAVAIASGIVARWTGGPMHQADQRGLLVLRRDLKVWAAEAPALYAPSPLWDVMIGEGRSFAA